MKTNYLVMSSYVIHGKVKTRVSEKMDLKLANLIAKLMKKNQSRYISVNVVPIW